MYISPKRKIFIFGFITGMALAVFAMTAQAEPSREEALKMPIEKVPAAGFAHGSNSGLSPRTNGEGFDCAVHWDVWATSFILKAMPKSIEDALPVRISYPASDSAKMAWRKKVAEVRGVIPVEAVIAIMEPTESRQKKQADLAAALRGDAVRLYDYTSQLAICGKPQ